MHVGRAVDRWLILAYNTAMIIDAKLYREALEAYRQWNEAKLIARAREAPGRDAQAGWREFNSLWAFARLTGARQTSLQRKQKLEALDLYYAWVKTLETWRQARGRTA
jgi:hypothetical protein